MNKVQKILVPINFSEDSANGLKDAVSLAQETKAELLVLHVTQKKEADSFLNLLAVMEGWPTLNPPAPIPVDRLLGEKALDLYRFIAKVVKDPRPAENQKKGRPREQRGTNFRSRQTGEYRSSGAWHAKKILFPLSDGSNKVAENDPAISVSGAY